MRIFGETDTLVQPMDTALETSHRVTEFCNSMYYNEFILQHPRNCSIPYNTKGESYYTLQPARSFKQTSRMWRIRLDLPV